MTFYAYLLGSLAWPIAAGVAAWQLARRVPKGWLIHLLFLPVLFAVEREIMELELRALGDKGEGPPSLGLLLLPGAAATALMVASYFGALAVVGLRRRSDAA